MYAYTDAFDTLASDSIKGIGAFRAVHILVWLYNAYGKYIHVPDNRMFDLLGPNVRELNRMCQCAGFTLKNLYDQVKVALPDMGPVPFEIWSCKVMNIIHVLHLHKQPSLAFHKSVFNATVQAVGVSTVAIDRRVTGQRRLGE